jgi:hypothetical protein
MCENVMYCHLFFMDRKGRSMLRQFVLSLSSGLLACGLTACQSNNETVKLKKEPKTIPISQSKGYNGFYDDYFYSSQDQKVTETIERAIESAAPTNKDVMILRPMYDIYIEYKDSSHKEMHLTLTDRGEQGYLSTNNSSKEIPIKFYKLSKQDLKNITDLIGDKA